MSFFKNFFESTKRWYNEGSNLNPKESLMIIIIVCIAGILYLIQKYTDFPVLDKIINFIFAVLEKLCTFISSL